jgi:hypothetical protein
VIGTSAITEPSEKEDRLGSFYPSRTTQIGAVLPSDLMTVTRGDGTPEILLDSPDCVEIQLQDVSYCRGRGPLSNMCG